MLVIPQMVLYRTFTKGNDVGGKGNAFGWIEALNAFEHPQDGELMQVFKGFITPLLHLAGGFAGESIVANGDLVSQLDQGSIVAISTDSPAIVRPDLFGTVMGIHEFKDRFGFYQFLVEVSFSLHESHRF